MTIITAERRILAYEDYPLPAEYMDEYLTTSQSAIATQIYDLTICWDRDGAPGVHLTFSDSHGKRFYAAATPPFRKEDQGWKVAIYRDNEHGKQVGQAECFCRLQDGTQMIMQDVVQVLTAAACIQMDAEDTGYPRT